MKLSFANFYEQKILNEISFNWTDPETNRTYSALDAPLTSIELKQSNHFGQNRFDYFFSQGDDNFTVSFIEMLKIEVQTGFFSLIDTVDETISDNKRQAYAKMLSSPIKNAYRVDLESSKTRYTPKLGKIEESDPFTVYGHVIVAMRKFVDSIDIHAFKFQADTSKLASLYHVFYKRFMKDKFIFLQNDFYVNKEKLSEGLNLIGKDDPEFRKKIEEYIPKTSKYIQMLKSASF